MAMYGRAGQLKPRDSRSTYIRGADFHHFLQNRPPRGTTYLTSHEHAHGGRPFPQMEGTEPSCPAQKPSSSPPLSRVRSARFGVSSGRPSHDEDDDDAERDPSTSAPAAKRRKKNTLDLSEVPMNLPPIPSDTPGSSSRFKGCLLYTSPSPRDVEESRMPSSA